GVFGSTFDRVDTQTIVPYRLAFEGQFYQTTGDYAFHKFKVDYPTRRYRLTLNSGWENWDGAPYYGNGARSIRDESLPTEYYQINLASLWLQPQMRFKIWKDLEGLILVTLRDVSIRHADNLLETLSPNGVDGGRLLMYALGITIDTRDKDPTPSSGYWLELSSGMAPTVLGSNFSTQYANATHRHWWSLTQSKQIVLASRTMLDVQRRSPFFQLSTFGGTQLVETGGHSLLRGLETGRVRGHRKAAQTLEIHLRLSPFEIFKKSLAPMFVLFGEVVHLSEHSDELWSSKHLLGSAGAGARLAVDEAFIVRLDFGFTPERIRTETGHLEWVNRFGSYVIVGHSF
ncbi:MAG: BamA/TamA family outer membrane protein, partial [Bradymonadia bacterium]